MMQWTGVEAKSKTCKKRRRKSKLMKRKDKEEKKSDRRRKKRKGKNIMGITCRKGCSRSR